ncbi:MAG: hypothetical protein GY696_31440 [Gammaproteobacteria bacterium]|nr:hypothetical protein [Gammaproteobacteria bacterium]
MNHVLLKVAPPPPFLATALVVWTLTERTISSAFLLDCRLLPRPFITTSAQRTAGSKPQDSFMKDLENWKLSMNLN